MKVSQVTFGAGEIDPALHARVDLARHQAALKTCRNFIILHTGGASNRPGTQFVYQSTTDTPNGSRLVPFIFSTEQAYMLEFADEEVAVFANGGLVPTAASVAITDVVLSGLGPYTRTITTGAAHGLTTGDTVTIAGVVATGTHDVNGVWTVTATPSGTTFRIKNASSNTGSYTSGGTASRAAAVASPYTSAQIESIRWTQSADVMTVTHPEVPVNEFERLSATSFAFAAVVFDTGPFLPENITAITITASAATGNITLTASSALFTADMVGALVRIDMTDFSAIPPWEPSKLLAASGVNPSSPALFRRSSGKVYQCVTNQAAPASGTYTGTVRPIHEEGTEEDGDGNLLAGAANTRAGVAWQYLHSQFGIARITGFTSSTVVNATVLSRIPVLTATDDWALGAWSDENGYPSIVTYYQDRRVFANTPAKPQTRWASKSGEYEDFGKHSPLEDSDAITETLNARQVNAILDLIPLDQLLTLTSASSWATPRRGETWVPETIGFDPQGYVGAADVPAVVIGDSAVFVERERSRIRDLRFDFSIDKFGGPELTVLARHLFRAASKRIRRWAYAEHPHGILWVVRDDGVLCGLTYLREQEVIAWHTHETDGFFEDVCVIPEDGRDVPYFIVRRTINGSTVRYIERLADREFDDLVDAFFVDSGLTYDGRNTGATTMILTGAVWTAGSSLTLTASATAFSPTDIGDQVWLYATDADGEEVFVRCEITAYTGPTIVTVEPLEGVPVELQAVAVTEWTFARDTFTGLGHLEAESVVAVVDGAVVTGLTVSAGAVTLDSPGGVVHIGLSYTADLETLGINVYGSETIRDRAKNTPHVAVDVLDTIGIKAGPDENNLEEMPARDEGEAFLDPLALRTEIVAFRCANTWDKNGHILIRQDNPLPATIRACHPAAEIGGNG